MPKISQKGQSMPQSPIRKLVPFAEKAYKMGKTVYHLNIGQPDIKTPQAALDAVKMHGLDILAYTRSEGSEEYRKKIANYYEKNDIHVKHDDIIVTTGGSEALLFAFGSIMDVDDEVIIPLHEKAKKDSEKSIETTAMNKTEISESLIDSIFNLDDVNPFTKLIQEVKNSMEYMNDKLYSDTAMDDFRNKQQGVNNGN